MMPELLPLAAAEFTPSLPMPDEDSRWFPADLVEDFNARRYDFYWDDNFTAFIPVKLKWWDDQSYMDYEMDGVDPADRDF